MIEEIKTVAGVLGESFGEILLHGFVDASNPPVTSAHFYPFSRFINDTRYEYRTDTSTRDLYWYDDRNTVRLKCLALVLGTPIVHSIGFTLHLANRVAKVLTFSHFWYPSKTDRSLGERSLSFGKDVLQIAFTPFVFAGLELSALYGLFLPENGKKLYATFERYAFGKELLAPCFQPYPTYHLFGGTAGRANEW